MQIDRKLFLEENEGLLLLKFSAPAAMGMLAIAFCSLVDTFFVGKFIGTEALAASTLALPIFMFFSAVSASIGIGAAAVWSVDVGAHNYKKAEKVFGNAIIINILVSLFIALLGTIFLDNILAFLGTPEEIYQLAKDYLGVLIPGCIFIIFTISMNNFIRAEGKAKTAMAIILIAALFNIIFDGFFIIGLKMGIKGAAYAALLGHFIAFVIILFHFTLGRSKLRFKKEMFVFDLSIIDEIRRIGTASFLRQISIGIMHFMVNTSIVWYSGIYASVYLAIAGISMKCIMLILMPVIGVLQGMQPIIGFNFGAKNFKRAKRTIILAILGAVCVASVSWLFIMIAPKFVLSIFSHDKEVINNGYNVVRLLILMLPFVAAQTTGAGLFQVLKKPDPANFFAVLRQIVLMIPIILILPIFMGLDGVWYAVPIADILAFIITAVWVIREIGLLEKLHKENDVPSELSAVEIRDK